MTGRAFFGTYSSGYLETGAKAAWRSTLYDRGMKRRAHIVLLVALFGMVPAAYTAKGQAPRSAQSKQKGFPNMSQDSAMIDLFNRWEQVWNEGKFDLVPSRVADSYVRHDPKGDRTVTRDAFSAEVAKISRGSTGHSRGRVRSFILR